MTISGDLPAPVRLRQPVCQREPTDLSTRAAGEAKLRIFVVSPMRVCLARLWLLAFFDDLIATTGLKKAGLMTTGRL